MAKKSFIVKNVTPLSQNNRSTATITLLGNRIMAAHNLKYPNDILCMILSGKVA